MHKQLRDVRKNMNRRIKWIIGLVFGLLILLFIGAIFIETVVSTHHSSQTTVSIQSDTNDSTVPKVSIASIPSVNIQKQQQISQAVNQVLQDPKTLSFDTSGFVQYIYQQVGVHVPRTIAEQIQTGTMIMDKTSLQIGDLVVFDLGNSPNTGTFDGIYVGHQQFAARTSQGIVEISLNQPYWNKRFIEGRRVL